MRKLEKKVPNKLERRNARNKSKLNTHKCSAKDDHVSIVCAVNAQLQQRLGMQRIPAGIPGIDTVSIDGKNSSKHDAGRKFIQERLKERRR